MKVCLSYDFLVRSDHPLWTSVDDEDIHGYKVPLFIDHMQQPSRERKAPFQVRQDRRMDLIENQWIIEE
jgi:hypothetical protein